MHAERFNTDSDRLNTKHILVTLRQEVSVASHCVLTCCHRRTHLDSSEQDSRFSKHTNKNVFMIEKSILELKLSLFLIMKNNRNSVLCIFSVPSRQKYSAYLCHRWWQPCQQASAKWWEDSVAARYCSCPQSNSYCHPAPCPAAVEWRPPHDAESHQVLDWALLEAVLCVRKKQVQEKIQSLIIRNMDIMLHVPKSRNIRQHW
jgi:hypothetical protein